MEDVIYVVRVNIGRQTKIEFEGIMLEYDDESKKFIFGEYDENLAPKNDGDIIVLDFKRKAVALNSNHFSMAMDILGHKKIGDNFYFKCATDLCRVDVYICLKSVWEAQGESIFA